MLVLLAAGCWLLVGFVDCTMPRRHDTTEVQSNNGEQRVLVVKAPRSQWYVCTVRCDRQKSGVNVRGSRPGGARIGMGKVVLNVVKVPRSRIKPLVVDLASSNP